MLNNGRVRVGGTIIELKQIFLKIVLKILYVIL